MEKTENTPHLRSRLTWVAACIPLLAGFSGLFLFLFFQFRMASLQSIAAANDSFGNYVDSVLELSNANIRTSAMQMFYTSSVRTLRTSGDLSWSERTIGHRDLGNFVSSSNFVDNVMVYNSNLDMVFTSESGYSSASTGEFHDQAAAEMLLHPQDHPYLAPFKRSAGVPGRYYYTFLFWENDSSSFSAMLLDVNADWYERQLLGNLSGDSHLIVDAQGQPVIPPEPVVAELPPWTAFENAFAGDPLSGYVLPDRSLRLSECWVYHKLGRTGWYYLELFRLKESAPGLVWIQSVVFAVFAAVCVILLILSAYLLFNILPTYFHVSRVLTAANLGGRDSAEKLDNLLSSHQAYESSRKLQELQAGVFPEDVPLPLVIVTARESKGLYDFLLLSIGVDERAMVAQTDLGLTFVLPACTNKRRNLFLGGVRDLGLDDPIFVSLPCYSGEQLTEAFNALEELRKLAFLYPSQNPLCQELLHECNQTSAFQTETAAAMEAALKKGHLDLAQAQWFLLFNAIRHDRYEDFSFALHYVDRMLSDLQHEYEVSVPAQPIDSTLTSLASLQAHMDRRMQAITQAVETLQRQVADSLCASVWSRIYSLYQDENCCSQMIAEGLDMNQNYLNRQFRAGTGMSINDAIQHVRIDKVCKLLRQSDLPVEQIAKQVGYSNTKYFFVLFKKYTGQTPTRFRIGQTDGE